MKTGRSLRRPPRALGAVEGPQGGKEVREKDGREVVRVGRVREREREVGVSEGLCVVVGEREDGRFEGEVAGVIGVERLGLELVGAEGLGVFVIEGLAVDEWLVSVVVVVSGVEEGAEGEEDAEGIVRRVVNNADIVVDRRRLVSKDELGEVRVDMDEERVELNGVVDVEFVNIGGCELLVSEETPDEDA